MKYIDDANITSLTTLDSSQIAEDVRCMIRSSSDKHFAVCRETSSVLCALFQAVDEINIQLGNLVTQSVNVFKESVSLHSEQIGTVWTFHEHFLCDFIRRTSL